MEAAIEHGNLDIVLEYIENNDVNQARTDDGATPLYMASQEGKADVVRMLVDAGADLVPHTIEFLQRELFLHIMRYYTQT